MKLLILGGTVFLGRHLVEAALTRGHRLTLFNRGQRNPELFAEVEKLRGDRDGGLSALEGRQWDAVIDTCGYFPRVVSQSARLLAGQVGHYTFISSISAFADASQPGNDENSPTGTLEDEAVEQITGETYGPLKALCEQAVEQALPGRALMVRPGLIVGPHDGSDRFTYWPRRVSQGGEVLAPGQPHSAVQFIDGRDLAEWIIRMVEANRTGIYNATGPGQTLSMGQTLDECQKVTGSPVTFTWVDEQFLLEAGVAPFTEVPLWVPVEDGSSHRGMNQVNINRALQSGLTFRPLAETIKDTLAWDATRPADLKRRAGLEPEREQQLLQAWHNRRAGIPT